MIDLTENVRRVAGFGDSGIGRGGGTHSREFFTGANAVVIEV